MLDYSVSMRMAISTRARVTTRASARSGTAILGIALLIAGLVFLLWLRLGFARYAFTAFLWQRTDGTVISTRRTTDPSIRFAAGDGSLHTFSQDYFLLCGRRSLCYRRNFTPGEVVPVVYDPAEPNRAFVRDFALYSTIFEWFVELFFLLLLAALLLQLIRGGSGNLSIQIGSRADFE
jgi:hypothetical protein